MDFFWKSLTHQEHRPGVPNPRALLQVDFTPIARQKLNRGQGQCSPSRWGSQRVGSPCISRAWDAAATLPLTRRLDRSLAKLHGQDGHGMPIRQEQGWGFQNKSFDPSILHLQQSLLSKHKATRENCSGGTTLWFVTALSLPVWKPPKQILI